MQRLEQTAVPEMEKGARGSKADPSEYEQKTEIKNTKEMV